MVQQAHQPNPVIFDNALAGTKSSLTLKCGRGYYVGQAHAEIALADERSSPLTLQIEVPAHALAQVTNDSKTFKVSEACPMLDLHSIESITSQVEGVLIAALELDKLNITHGETQPAFQWRIYVNVSCLTLDSNPLDMATLCALSTLLLLHFPSLSFDAERKWWRQEINQKPAFTGMDCFSKLPVFITCTQDVESGEYFIDEGFGEGPARALAAVCHHYETGTLKTLDCRSLLRLPSPSNVSTNTFASEFAKIAAITQKSADIRIQALNKAYHAATN